MIEIQSEYASKGQRVLLLAKRIIGPDLLSKEALLDPTTMEDKLLELIVELTIIGLVALVDPPRLDTEETVRICRRAGIRYVVLGHFS
jgi:sodium/potassium-transporting ATPase subunit alpha